MYIKGILGVLVKISLNKILFSPISLNFKGNENLGDGGNKEE